MARSIPRPSLRATAVWLADQGDRSAAIDVRDGDCRERQVPAGAVAFPAELVGRAARDRPQDARNVARAGHLQPRTAHRQRVVDRFPPLHELQVKIKCSARARRGAFAIR